VFRNFINLSAGVNFDKFPSSIFVGVHELGFIGCDSLKFKVVDASMW
jgi:hypothetical protein